MTTTHFFIKFILLKVLALLFLGLPLAQARIITDCTQVTQIPQAECEALLDIYHSTNGPDWKNKWGWRETNKPCHWHSRRKSVFAVAGVTCKGGHVTMLHLINNQLSGSIPQSIGNLKQLQYLFLAKNDLSGLIPDSLGKLSQLRKLWLNDNYLSGPIPDFLGNLSQLRELLLNGNQFSGPISEVISNLSQLDFLNLSQNQFSGLFPKALINLSKRIIDDNNLSDSICIIVTQIPQAECKALFDLYHSTKGPHWKNNEGWNKTNTPCYWKGVTCQNGHVTRLDLSDNQLSGPIPESMGYRLSQLTSLELDYNQLSGPIPPSLGHLSQLRTLDLNDNQLSGPIPPSLGYVSQLQQLDLSDNQFSGLIPQYLGHLSQLRTLVLDDNQLSGPIPESIGNLSQLERLDLSDNQLSGPIPTPLKNLNHLSSLNLLGNHILKRAEFCSIIHAAIDAPKRYLW